MLRGVNKCVIEINGGNSKYFERALIFVRPEYAALSQSKLMSDGRQFLSEIEENEAACEPGYRRRAEKRKRRINPAVRKLGLTLLVIGGIVLYSFIIKSI